MYWNRESPDMRLQTDGLICHLFASNAGRDEKDKAMSCVEMKDYNEATKRILCDWSDFVKSQVH